MARDIRKYWMIPYVILLSLPVIAAFMPDCPLKFSLQAGGNILLGFYIYYVGILAFLLALYGLVYLLSQVIYGKKAMDKKKTGDDAGILSSRWHGRILCFSLLFAACICIYGMIHSQYPKTVNYKLSVEKETDGIGEMKVVLIGDLHLSVNSRLSLTERMVDLVNKEDPDLVLVAGDVFTSSYEGLRHPEEYAGILHKIKSKFGVYAVYGNHDVEETLIGGFAIAPASQAFRTRKMEEFFEKAGFITLEDQMVTLPGNIQLAGRIDGQKAGDGSNNRMSPEELLKEADRKRPILLLQHEPVDFESLSQAGADLVMCGHTHDGQIFPGNIVVDFFNENGWGYKEMYGMKTLVTAGVGYYGPPMRVGTNSEVTVIDLSFK